MNVGDNGILTNCNINESKKIYILNFVFVNTYERDLVLTRPTMGRILYLFN